MHNEREKQLFICNLIDAFSCLNVTKIPFGNENYNAGIKALEEKMKEEFPDSHEDLKILFLRKPISGNYDVFDNAIMLFLGSKVYTLAPDSNVLRMSSSTAKKPDEMYLKLAKVFAEKSHAVYRT